MRSRALPAVGAAVCMAFVLVSPSGGQPRLVGGTPPSALAASTPVATSAVSPEARRIAAAALAQVGVTTSYESAYVHLEYPGGDVPLETGVCADLVVRAFRGIGVDLQYGVHEDMKADLAAYPQPFGLAPPDTNIDHRRVHNLQRYFERRGMSLPPSINGADYLPGDVVTWMVAGYPHIGIVSDVPALSSGRYQVVHNIGSGAQVEDALFRMEITGHYRWR